MCGRRVLRKDSDTLVELQGLRCNQWGCPECARRKRAKVRAMGRDGAPEKILTLTYAAGRQGSLQDHFDDLVHAWDVLLKRMRRRYRPARIEYMPFVEAQKNGEPHLHILLRAPFIDQAWISDQMAELIGSPIVDIRKVRSTDQAVKYLTKYLTKNPARYGNSKRYWTSRGWLLHPDLFKKEKRNWIEEGFRVSEGSFEEQSAQLIALGYTPEHSASGTTLFSKPGYSAEYPTGPPAPRRLKDMIYTNGWHSVWRGQPEVVGGALWR